MTTINDLFKSDSKLKCVEFGGGGVVGRGLFSFWAFLKGKGGLITQTMVTKSMDLYVNF